MIFFTVLLFCAGLALGLVALTLGLCLSACLILMFSAWINSTPTPQPESAKPNTNGRLGMINTLTPRLGKGDGDPQFTGQGPR